MLNMPLKNMRGQSYDGAANMSGAYNVEKSLILVTNEFDHYTHCGANRINVIAKYGANNEHIDSILSIVNDIGSLFSRSITFRNILFSEVDIFKLKSMCSIRFTVRLK